MSLFCRIVSLFAAACRGWPAKDCDSICDSISNLMEVF
jgi:hypothetical protein